MAKKRDMRDDCRWYGGDCGQGEKCSDECFGPHKEPGNWIPILFNHDHTKVIGMLDTTRIDLRERMVVHAGWVEVDGKRKILEVSFSMPPKPSKPTAAPPAVFSIDDSYPTLMWQLCQGREVIIRSGGRHYKLVPQEEEE